MAVKGGHIPFYLCAQQISAPRYHLPAENRSASVSVMLYMLFAVLLMTFNINTDKDLMRKN